jgi:serine/threonine-protein kinase RsbW
VTDKTTTSARSATAAATAAQASTAAARAAEASAAAAGAAELSGVAMGASAQPADGMRDEVTVRMPADGAYLSVLRTATAGLAARLDFTLDDIEDLRIAVDEACAMLLSQAIPGSSLDCTFSLSPDMLTISVSVPCLSPRLPTGDTFAWTVLTALAGSVEAQVGPEDRLAIVMRKRRPGSV